MGIAKPGASTRVSLGGTIFAMGVLGVALALVTGEIFRSITLDNQHQTFQQIVRLETDAILQHNLRNTTEFLHTLQADSDLRRLYEVGDQSALTRHLNGQFHRYFVTAAVIDLLKLYMLDATLAPIAESTLGDRASAATLKPCPTLLARAAGRTGAERIKTLSELCDHHGRPYLAVLAPLGGLRASGYLLALVDPARDLSQIENRLGMPTTLQYHDGTIAYRSGNWPPADRQSAVLNVAHQLVADTGSDVLTVNIAYDISGLQERLASARAWILAIAAMITFAAAMLGFSTLNRTTLRPLAELSEKLRRVRGDKAHLGEQLQVTGAAELTNIAHDFNAMTKELKVLYRTLESMAFTDSLTGLPNRTHFHDRLQHECNQAKRHESRFALFLMDLDRFKHVNDTLGHHIGDQLLQEVSHRIREALRTSDTMARLGGDEFAALLTDIHNHQDAQVVAEKIVGAMEMPFNIDERNLGVGISIGIVLSPEHGSDSTLLLQRADVAMYHAKQNTRGFTFYDSILDENALLRLSLESDLREAIEQDALELHYQPKILLQDGLTVGTEALLRWNHPQRGYIPPDQFIPIAEQTSLIHPLTRWVLHAALHQVARWHRKGLWLSVAVNLSARSLDDPQIVEAITETLKIANVEPRWLTLEITEGAVMSDPEHALELLSQLSAHGIRLSIDDFGTGYSSLAYLKKLPVHEIKIDRSFVMDMHSDSSDAVIVRSTIDLAHNMGLQVVAEGVESQDTWLMLEELGCDAAQGFHMSRPLPPTALTSWLLSASTDPKNAAGPAT